MIKPRPYQLEAKESIFNYFREGNKGNPIVAMPVGTGKSVTIGDFTREALQTYPGTRIMMLTHVKELIAQNYSKLKTIWEQAPAGIYSAGLGKKEFYLPITFGGIGSVARTDVTKFGAVDLVLIDECHLVSPNQETQYRKTINAMKQVNPSLKVIGFTATPYRLGSGMLVEDSNGLFTDVCCDMTSKERFAQFFEEGYLTPLIPKATGTTFNLAGVRTTGGDYNEHDLQEAVDDNDLTKHAVEEILYHGATRHKWLIFSAGVQHGEHIQNMLLSRGVPTGFVHSKMTTQQRDNELRLYETGEYRAMVNNGILTTGYDNPHIDLIAVLRPSKSAVYWVQVLGRGTRNVYAQGFDLDTTQGRLDSIQAGTKQNCLVLDFAQNTERLGAINDPVLPHKKGKKGKQPAPVKVCPSCLSYNFASVTYCKYCGVEFPRELALKEASTKELIVTTQVDNPIVEVFQVTAVTYHAHTSGKGRSIKVTYLCGTKMFSEFVCLEYDGWAGRQAVKWWKERSLNGIIPGDVETALEYVNALKKPLNIRVWLKKPYNEILAFDFTGEFKDGSN